MKDFNTRILRRDICNVDFVGDLGPYVSTHLRIDPARKM